jgi:hypothetical protein
MVDWIRWGGGNGGLGVAMTNICGTEIYGQIRWDRLRLLTSLSSAPNRSKKEDKTSIKQLIKCLFCK